MVDRALLAHTALFASLPPEVVDTVAAACTTRRLNRNDVLFRARDAASEMFVVEQGRVAIANRSADGKESVMALMEAGDLFGEMGLFDCFRSTDAPALEPSTVVAIP